VCADTVVSTATRYGLDFPGIETWGSGTEFHLTLPDGPLGLPTIL